MRPPHRCHLPCFPSLRLLTWDLVASRVPCCPKPQGIGRQGWQPRTDLGHCHRVLLSSPRPRSAFRAALEQLLGQVPGQGLNADGPWGKGPSCPAWSSPPPPHGGVAFAPKPWHWQGGSLQQGGGRIPTVPLANGTCLLRDPCFPVFPPHLPNGDVDLYLTGLLKANPTYNISRMNGGLFLRGPSWCGFRLTCVPVVSVTLEVGFLPIEQPAMS